MDKNTRILIVGAGIAGAAVALKLEQLGFTPTLIEKQPQWERRGYAITLMPPGVSVMHRLGLAEAVARVGTPLRHYLLQTADGRTIRHFDFTGQPSFTATTAHRADLQKILLDALRQTHLRWGETVQEIQQTAEQVTVHFDSGSQAAFDLVIAADGVHSAIRGKALQTISSNYTGIVMVAFSLPLNGLSQADCITEIWDSRGHFGIYPYGTTAAVDYAFPYPYSAEPDYEAIAAHARHQFRDFKHPVVQHVLAQMPATSDVFITQVHNTKGAEWFTGQIIAIGDAAHAVLPTAGMGASLALGDAEVLAQAVADESSPLDAARRLMRERKATADQVQREGVWLKQVMLLPQP